MKQRDRTTVIHIPSHLPEHVKVRAVLGPEDDDRTSTLIELHFEGGNVPIVETPEGADGRRIRLLISGSLERQGLVAALHALGMEMNKA
ncbi:hypothetical protein [Myxococcus stipitatus]|uniref:hypothetical protein n=1 Tax=Myxococcus stipitatus TaxID=83455 RepID=UPI0030CAC478